MGQTFHCGDTEALVGFLYEECETDERAAIAAHLAICSACAAEAGALSVTRQQLSAWTPPDARLDFRLTDTPTSAPRVRWWSNPLPAWAQLAAALLIFAVGTGLGLTLTRNPAWAAVTSGASDATAIDRLEVARLEQRVRDVERKSMTAVPAAMDVASRDTMAMLVQREIRASESRIRLLLAERLWDLNYERALEGEENARVTTGGDGRAAASGPSLRFASFGGASAREE